MALVRALPMPSMLAEFAARDEVPGLQAWVRRLPEVVEELAGRWQLRLDEPYQPGGQCSWVAPASGPAGDVVLKVGWRHDEAEHEADALRFWDGDGAVRLIAAETFEQTSALLLERCHPGHPLGHVAAEAEQDVVVAEMLRRLWRQPPAGHPFRPLVAMCDAWAEEFEEKAARRSGAVDPGLARDGMRLFRELPRTASADMLLCTDLHAENILAARREPWLVVDPKPYVGDPAYDALQHLLDCRERLVADPGGFCRRMASLLDLDEQRLRAWLFARCVQEGLDQPVLLRVATRLGP